MADERTFAVLEHIQDLLSVNGSQIDESVDCALLRILWAKGDLNFRFPVLARAFRCNILRSK